MKILRNRGFPQGGVTSAKFWIIAFDKAICFINKHSTLGQGYANDCAALMVGREISMTIKNQ